MPEKIRTFIAIELPDYVTHTISTVQKHLKSEKMRIKWVIPENIHLTLRFLGDILLDDLDAVAIALEKSVEHIPRFSLYAGGIGAFPGLARPRVIWVGIGGDMDPLRNLYDNLCRNLKTAGIPKEKRKFKGHLTIGRVKGRIDPIKMVEAVREIMEFKTELFPVRQVVLFRSDLKPTGAVYRKLFTAEIK